MADQERGYGRGASTRDAAARGSVSYPMTEAMPVTPQATLDPEPNTIPDAMVHRDHASEMVKADK